MLVGLNIGASNITGVLVGRDGKIREETKRPAPESYQDLLSNCRAVVDELQGRHPVSSSIGVGVTGSVDYAKGSVSSYYYPFLKALPLKNDLTHTLQKEIHLENDANCAAYAEATEGAGKGHPTVLGLTLGRGVGAGFIVDGRIMRGRNGLAAEVGLLPIYPFAEYAQMLCIKKGPYLNMGDVLCGPGMSLLHQAMTGRTAEPHEIAQQAQRNDPQAQVVLNRYYELMADGMKGVIYALDPHVIVACGPLSTLPGLSPRVSDLIKKCSSSRKIDTPFVPAAYGPLASACGAALLCR